MKVVHINKMDYGGAFAAAFRLFYSQVKDEYDVNFIVDESIGADALIKSTPSRRLSFLAKTLNKLRIKEIPSLLQHRINKDLTFEYEMFRFYLDGKIKSNFPLVQTADIIHLHWVVGMVTLDFIKNSTKPIVWTLHDMNAFTGGCHYSVGCDGYLTNCNNCPGLANNYPSRELARKIRTLSGDQRSNLTIVSPSKWLYKAASASNLFKGYRHEYIPYGLNQEEFYIHDKAAAKKGFGLPSDKKIILFCSGYETYRKGFDLLLDFYVEYQRKNQDTLLVCVGPTTYSGTEANVFSLGYLKDNISLSKAYSAADLLVVSSREDNLPNTVLEGLFCGCPVVGFNIGGMPDMINDGTNGYLSKEVTSKSLGEAVKMALNDEMLNSENIRANAVEKFSLKNQLNSYKALYYSILTGQ